MSRYKDYDRIGVELEGAWERPAPPLRHDGSLRFRRDNVEVGEMVSEPLRLPQALKWVKENYPNYVNHTCGMHIHTSMNLLDYSRIMSEDFFEKFLSMWESWGRENNAGRNFFARLEGGNRFCQKKFEPSATLSGERHDRYTMLNFCAFHEHGTVENRLLPMFPEIDTAISAIKFHVHIIRDYLKEQDRPISTEYEVII